MILNKAITIDVNVVHIFYLYSTYTYRKYLLFSELRGDKKLKYTWISFLRMRLTLICSSLSTNCHWSLSSLFISNNDQSEWRSSISANRNNANQIKHPITIHHLKLSSPFYILAYSVNFKYSLTITSVDHFSILLN